MNDRDIAIYLRDKCSRRLSGRELALCELVITGAEIHTKDQQWFDSLKTQFASELANVAEAPAVRETANTEGVLL